jgi:hypothetical protein
MKDRQSYAFGQLQVLLLPLVTALPALANNVELVDTGQVLTYDDQVAISPPAPGGAFHGQDGQYDGNQPSYTLSGDGLTVHDQVTGLTWVASPDTDGDGILESPGDKLSWWDAMNHPATLNAQAFGGYDDWRVPSIKELYSLIDFSGVDPSGYTGSTSGLVPFIDTAYFAFEYGNLSANERIIDSQYWSSTEYVSTTMNGDHTVFGVNFADGRIKGYGTSLHGTDKLSFVLCCRGNLGYGDNSFTDNGDDTVTDAATGLVWTKGDSGSGMTWEDALAYAENLVFGGHDDWRLPNAKELQVILDYTRSPATHGTAAIDPIFNCSVIVDEGGAPNYPFYWAGTTHANWTTSPGAAGVYVCFGEALGWMQAPFPPYNWSLMDVHGAGSQRSDPKTGNPADYPHGHGPQGDVVRIYNHVRCVRDDDGCEPDAEIYCTAKTTTSGCTPALDYDGIPSATASSGFTVTAQQVEHDQFGIFFFSLTGARDVPFMGGTLCVQAPQHRTAVQNAGNGGSPPCTGVMTIDLNAAGICAMAGEGNEVWIQAWFRDPPDAYGSGLTDAVRLTVCP